MMLKGKMILVIMVSFLCISSVAFSQSPQGSQTKAGAVSSNEPSLKATDKSESKGTTSCSCKSGDKKKSCSVSCKEGESAFCDCDETTASCTCN